MDNLPNRGVRLSANLPEVVLETGPVATNMAPFARVATVLVRVSVPLATATAPFARIVAALARLPAPPRAALVASAPLLEVMSALARAAAPLRAIDPALARTTIISTSANRVKLK